MSFPKPAALVVRGDVAAGFGVMSAENPALAVVGAVRADVGPGVAPPNPASATVRRAAVWRVVAAPKSTDATSACEAGSTGS